ncbi:MAG: family 20 glycosylhydrolase, partial [Chitinophagaceae bacterium]
PKTHWKKCAACQQRMSENGLNDEHELQSYFVQRIEKYLNSKGKILIGWDEILEGGLAPNAVVMSWRGEKGGIEAAKQKHAVIMTPGKPVYFDHSQSKLEDSITIGGYNPIEAVYAYEPIPKELNQEEAAFVLGAQANVWTEYMNNTKKIEYMIFPRMAALSEVLWTRTEQKNWNDFERRLNTQFQRYDFFNMHYSKAYFEPAISIVPGSSSGKIKMTASSKNASIRFRAAKISAKGDEQKITSESNDAFNIEIAEPGNYALYSSMNNQQLHRFVQSVHISKATNASIILATPASKSYPGDGAFTLVNGVINTKGMMRSYEYLGFSGSDCEAVISFNEPTELKEVTVHAMEQHTSWIYAPKDIDVFTSNDGVSFEKVEITRIDVNKQPRQPAFSIGIGFKARNAKYVKVIVKNAGTIEAGYPGAGNKAWLFVSELLVN